jgi:hypothetical protein
LILAVTEVVDTAWAYQYGDKEPVPTLEPDAVEDRQWLGRKKLLANNFSKLAAMGKLYLKFTQQIWPDNQPKKPGAKNRNGTFPTALPTSNLLSIIALSRLPIKKEMSSPGQVLVLVDLKGQKKELPLLHKPLLKARLDEPQTKECGKSKSWLVDLVQAEKLRFGRSKVLDWKLHSFGILPQFLTTVAVHPNAVEFKQNYFGTQASRLKLGKIISNALCGW